MAQFGLAADPIMTAKWEHHLKDDPVNPAVAINTRGQISFATSGPNSRTTQIFINVGDNSRLDNMGFSPFGRVGGVGQYPPGVDHAVLSGNNTDP